jgi:HEAT repeats/PBS lyase HEAT-like repeat
MSDASPPSPAAAAPRRGRAIRAKLVSLALLANMAGLVVAIYVARSVRGGHVSDGGETPWFASYYAAMFVVAVFDAFLLDELVFGGSFRRKYLQGHDERHLERSGDDSALAASLRPNPLGFPMVAVLCGGLTYLLFNLANDGFDSWHRTIGRHLAALRSDDPELQRIAITELSIRRDGPVVPALVQALQAGGPTAPWAAWALGRFYDLPTLRPVITPLVGATHQDDPAVRREALIALGRLQHRASAPAIHAEIRAQTAAGETVDPRLLYALGSIQVLSSVPLLEELLVAADEETQRMAAWALAQHRDQREGREVVEVLERRLPSASLPVRCAIVHALGILADERSNLALVRAYDDATPDELETVCPRITVAFRPDGGDDQSLLLRPERKLAMKVILAMGQMRATSPDVRAVVEPWLVARVADASTIYEAREGGQSLLAGIRAGRDDMLGQGADQADPE